MRLYFLRHGQIDDNITNIFTGQVDAPLNSHGRQQARDAIAAVIPLGITQIIASDLSRASDTAMIIADGIGLGREHLHITPDLREVGVGKLLGQPIRPGVLAAARATDPTIESVVHLQTRLRRVLDGLKPGSTTLLVGHSGSGRMLQSLLTGTPAEQLPTLPNCQVIELPMQTYFTSKVPS